MDDEQRIALVEIQTQGIDASPKPLIRYQFGNHLGSASVELDEQAKIISYEEYYPYGSTSYQAVGNQTETPKRCRYTGKERDEESGFYYHGARYYAAWLGRWTAADPAGMVDGVNLYAFVHDNPLNGLDVNGKKSKHGLSVLIFQSEMEMKIGSVNIGGTQKDLVMNVPMVIPIGVSASFPQKAQPEADRDEAFYEAQGKAYFNAFVKMGTGYDILKSFLIVFPYMISDAELRGQMRSEIEASIVRMERAIALQYSELVVRACFDRCRACRKSGADTIEVGYPSWQVSSIANGMEEHKTGQSIAIGAGTVGRCFAI